MVSQYSKQPRKSFLRRLVRAMCFASLPTPQKEFLWPLLLLQHRREARWYKQNSR